MLANKNYKKAAYKTTLKKGNVEKRKWTLFTKKSINRLDSSLSMDPFQNYEQFLSKIQALIGADCCHQPR